MKKGILLSVASMLVFSVAAMAIPITVVTGTWTNPWGEHNNADGITIYGSSTNSTVSWGVGTQYPTNQSSYNWTSADTTDLDVSIGTVFSLGTFTHNNFEITTTSNALKTVKLDFAIGEFDSAQILSTAFDFFHNETTNTGAGCCDDIVEVNPVLNAGFSYLGEDYFFSLLGFSRNNGLTISTEFITEEGKSNHAELYAIITATPIPEPASLVIFGTGLGLLGLAAWRKKK